jgi:hypothetical protein
MHKFLTTVPPGCVTVPGLAIVELDDVDRWLTKTMFELSRDGSDLTTHFDPAIHSLDAMSGVRRNRPSR